MSPIAWAMRPLKRYAQFSGRAPRAEFWWFMLFVLIAYLVMWVALAGAAGGIGASSTDPSMGIGAMGVGAIFLGLFWLAMIVPTIAVQVRRLHDLNRSGWWVGGFYLLYLAYMAVTLSLGLSAAAGTEEALPGGGMIAAITVLGLLFFVYSIVLLVFFCMRGTRGPNRYGEDPYGGDLEEVFA